MNLTRREFVKLAGAAAAAVAGSRLFPFRALEAAAEELNPLAAYPSRGWEKVYLDQYRYDAVFSFVCSPNDTHACRLEAFVRNGIMVRTEPSYDVGKYGDVMGNKASPNWGPRTCLKGFTYPRRVYGPYRLKYPIIRKGWKRWADDGFPVLDPERRKKYLFDARGEDEFLRVSWEEAFRYVAKGLVAIAKTYSGEAGAKLLREQGYPEEMIEDMGGAGTRCCKFRGGMGLLGVIGKYGMYRVANSLALLDAKIRGVPKEKARGGRVWSNYTWHGDQAPGHPFVHGLQASDCDFNDLRYTKLHIHAGKNLVENKMPDTHFFIESIERGAKIYVIAPEYSPPATKADCWIPIRPATDAALFLGITKILIDEKKYDADFVKRFTDFPLLIRTDTLERLTNKDLGLPLADLSGGPSMAQQGLTAEQHERLGDYVVFDTRSNAPAVVTRDDVGERLVKKGIDPALEGRFQVKLADGNTVEVMTIFESYKLHLRDYDLDTVAEITGALKDKIRALANDIATIKPVAIHVGEGINHWFHATEANRATYLPLMLTGNIGIPGAGSHTWAGNYKAACFQASPESGPGFKGWIAEDPFEIDLDPTADGKSIHAHSYCKDEEVAYWNHGDRPLIVETPKYGRRCFTGKTHMPTPTKALLYTNVNLINQAKHAYDMIKNVDPMIDMIVSVDIEMTSSVEYSDIALAASSWCECQSYEITASCSNPFIQIWKGGMPPLYDTQDDAKILAGITKAIGDEIGDRRFYDYFKFIHEGDASVYIQRLLDASITTRGYKLEDIMAGKYGTKGAVLLLSRTYPRNPFYEQIHDSLPFFTPTGRLQSYNDEPEVIEYGENFVVHREGPEATPFLPNVIVSSNPLVRPEDYGIPREAMHWDERTIRNIKLPWAEVKKTKNPLWEAGYRFYLLTPKSRHTVHSSWTVTDWNLIWSSNFGDPHRTDRRTPGVGENQVHMNPEAAKALGIADGDYVYIDANPADRPYRGWKPDDPFYKVARCMVRVKYNPAYPYNVLMLKHASFIATERSVKAHETREDRRALSAGTGYQSNFRYGSQQSLTRDWSMPMHQTDSLFHKAKIGRFFIFGGEADNHGVNTVPKETLVRVVKAEDGGLGGKGVWAPATRGLTPGNESEIMKKYLAGEFTRG
jgi:nitrate reductase alpha subunit